MFGDGGHEGSIAFKIIEIVRGTFTTFRKVGAGQHVNGARRAELCIGQGLTGAPIGRVDIPPWRRCDNQSAWMGRDEDLEERGSFRAPPTANDWVQYRG